MKLLRSEPFTDTCAIGNLHGTCRKFVVVQVLNLLDDAIHEENLLRPTPNMHTISRNKGDEPIFGCSFVHGTGSSRT